MQQARLFIMKRVVETTALFTAVLLASCASTGVSIEKPAMTLKGVEMSSLSFTGQTFVLSFDVNNPNPFPLPIRSVRYHVASLSGGQRQAIAVAKAVMWNSRLVILDEPTAALGVAQYRM